jgi:2-polyprenyl-6-methoxyphenol hydroxylase-like FAD-dependent oxidoreductase
MENLDTDKLQDIGEDVVLISGGGPVGLMVAVVLARYGVRSIILERNLSTTKYVESARQTSPLTLKDGQKWI